MYDAVKLFLIYGRNIMQITYKALPAGGPIRPAAVARMAGERLRADPGDPEERPWDSSPKRRADSLGSSLTCFGTVIASEVMIVTK